MMGQNIKLSTIQLRSQVQQMKKIQVKQEISSLEEEFKPKQNQSYNKKKYPAYKSYSKNNRKYRYDNDQKQCPLCHKSFSDIYTMNTHLKGVHNLNPHMCKGCNQSFKSSKELKDHIEYSHIKNLKNQYFKNNTRDNLNVEIQFKQSVSSLTEESTQAHSPNYKPKCTTLQHYQSCKLHNDSIPVVRLLGGQFVDEKERKNTKYNIFNLYFNTGGKVAMYKQKENVEEVNQIEKYKCYLSAFYNLI